MKKVFAIFLCMIMTVVMIPSFFASAVELPSLQEAVVVAADDNGTGQVDNSLKGLPEVLGTLYTLITEGMKTLFGEDFIKNIIPALKKVLSLVSIGDFFKTIGRLLKNP